MSKMISVIKIAPIAVFITLFLSGTANAVPMTFTDRAAFDAAVAGIPGGSISTLDFDAVSAGTVVADGGSLGGIVFGYNFGGVQMEVSDAFDTSSPPNFLGTDDAGVFQSGDDFTMSFAPSRAFGVFIISADPVGATLFDGDIVLEAAGAQASLATSDIQQILPDGSNVFFLGVVDPASSFATASLTSTCCGFFLFNADDVVTASAATNVPEPSSPSLLGFGLAGLGLIGLGVRQRARHRRVT